MKKVALLFAFLLGLQQVSALACTDIATNVFRYEEDERVRMLQDFLYEKGYLKAVPNGYFGVGTLAALKAYQKANGITQTGTAGPLTRATIKSESCGASATKVTTGATTTKTTTTPSIPVTTVVAAQPKPVSALPSVPLTKNEQRWKDSDILLRGIYQYFVSSRGVWPLPASSTSTSPRELCVAPRVTEMASTGEVAVVVTAASPCKDYVDVSYLLPNILTVVPRDPNLATTSILLGYSILRDELNNISIVPKTTDNKEIIKVRCNFDLKCSSISRVSQEEYGVPVISSLSRTILLKDANAKSGVTISGKNFTASTTVILQSKTTQRIYEVGPFVSATDGRSFIFDATTTSVELPCGVGCKEKLPIGDYSFQVKTQGGLSNVMYITIKGFTTSSISARANSTVTASSTDVKLGTITVSASLPGTLTSLTLRSTSTSSKLPGKITGFKLKDLSSNKTITASGLTFSLSNTPLADNASRFYDLYANIGNVLVDEAGYITYGGDFLMKDTLGGVDILLPIKEISFSVAPW